MINLPPFDESPQNIADLFPFCTLADDAQPNNKGRGVGGFPKHILHQYIFHRLLDRHSGKTTEWIYMKFGRNIDYGLERILFAVSWKLI